jgi:hypothetical protein
MGGLSTSSHSSQSQSHIGNLNKKNQEWREKISTVVKKKLKTNGEIQTVIFCVQLTITCTNLSAQEILNSMKIIFYSKNLFEPLFI